MYAERCRIGPETPLLHIAHLYFVPVFATAWSVHEQSEIGARFATARFWTGDGTGCTRVHPAAGGRGHFEAFRSHDVDVMDCRLVSVACRAA
jgi:hypothetical protein